MLVVETYPLCREGKFWHSASEHVSAQHKRIKDGKEHRYYTVVEKPQCAGQDPRSSDKVEHPPRPDRMGATNTGRYDYGGMGPPATPAIVEAAERALVKPLPAGPFAATWDSLQKNYRTPSWFEDSKFGIFMHWGVFSVAAHHNEWYEKHMYAAEAQWHAEHFGPQEKFGYKDLIPLFTADKWDPGAWAALFKKSGARVSKKRGASIKAAAASKKKAVKRRQHYRYK